MCWHDPDGEPYLAQGAIRVAAMDWLGEREPLAPHDGQSEDVEAAPHVVAGEQHDLIVLDDGVDVLVRQREVVEVANDHGLPSVGRGQ
eukprot:3804104-Heterocapsa_arctica.AAC.1